MFRILSFRANRDEIENCAGVLLAVAITVTWFVGIGRWWDDPRELPMLARLGFGSVLYVFVLAALLWIIARPISDEPVGYLPFASFVAATALPAAVYAVPVENMVGSESASLYNLYALSFVSLYRVALLIWFLRKIVGLEWIRTTVSVLLPISGIVFALTVLGHGARVMDIMGGLRDSMSKTAMEEMVGLMGCLAIIVGPICLILYVGIVSVDRTSK